MVTSIISLIIAAIVAIAIYRATSKKSGSSCSVTNEYTLDSEIKLQETPDEFCEPAESLVLESPIEDIQIPVETTEETNSLGEKWVQEEPIVVKKETKKSTGSKKKPEKEKKTTKAKAKKDPKGKTPGKKGRKPGKDKMLLS